MGHQKTQIWDTTVCMFYEILNKLKIFNVHYFEVVFYGEFFKQKIKIVKLGKFQE